MSWVQWWPSNQSICFTFQGLIIAEWGMILVRCRQDVPFVFLRKLGRHGIISIRNYQKWQYLQMPWSATFRCTISTLTVPFFLCNLTVPTPKNNRRLTFPAKSGSPQVTEHPKSGLCPNFLSIFVRNKKCGTIHIFYIKAMIMTFAPHSIVLFVDLLLTSHTSCPWRVFNLTLLICNLRPYKCFLFFFFYGKLVFILFKGAVLVIYVLN